MQTLKIYDVANAALFLVSVVAKYISGQNLFVEGGFAIANQSFNMFKYPKKIVSCMLLSLYN